MRFVLKEKTKLLKGRIKEWNRAEYGGSEDRCLKLVEEIVCLDEKGVMGVLSDQEVEVRK
jgi:hypothetical protein